MATPDIIQAATDPQIFGAHFRDMESWRPWRACLCSIFGLMLSADELLIFRQCTGREEPPTECAKETWLIVGRRGGKSRVLALIAAYLSAFIDWSPYLAPGERGFIVIVAADRKQCRVIISYIRAFLSGTPLLADLIENDASEELALSNGLTIEVVTSSYRSVRSRTVIAALCDECAFWADDSGANPASEVIAALRPAMATIPGALLLVASSPYAKRGPLWNAFKRYFGKTGRILVWKADTRTMNPTVPAEFIDEAYQEDPASAAAEYGAEFRSDVDTFVAREIIEAAVVSGRREMMRAANVHYVAFVDPSGGSSDSMTLAIAHLQDKTAVLDALREWRPPFSPDAVVQECAALLKSYGISSVRGDRYAGEWPRERFKVHGITYEPSEQAKSEIYLAFLPLLNSGRVELLDDARAVAQIAGLERRTARSGRDSIDHAPGAHDDIANSIAGALVLASSREAPMIINPDVVRRSANRSTFGRTANRDWYSTDAGLRATRPF